MESSALQAAESVCVKAEPCEDVCITGTGEPTFEGVSVKAEPLLDEMCIKDEPGRESVSIRAESSCSYVRVKNESHGVSAAAALYADHAVKDELVLGPELVERRGVRRAPTVSASNLAIKVKQSCGNVAGRTFQMDGCVKLEPLVVDTLLTGTRSTDQDCLRQVQETGIECENKNSAVGNFEIYNRGTFFHCTFTRMHIFELWCATDGSYIDRARHILQILAQELPEEAKNVNVCSLHNRLNNLSRSLSTFWKKERRSRVSVISKYNEWLNSVEDVDLHIAATSSTASVLMLDNKCNNAPKLGRPKKDYDSCSNQTKRRRLAELSEIDKSSLNSSFDIPTDNIRSEVNVDEVLSLLEEAKLTKHQYQLIQKFVNSKNNPVLPSYAKILQAKKRCYPEDEEEKITVNGKSAEVEIQNLLDHPAS